MGSGRATQHAMRERLVGALGAPEVAALRAEVDGSSPDSLLNEARRLVTGNGG
jgi:hypothetical protein